MAAPAHRRYQMQVIQQNNIVLFQRVGHELEKRFFNTERVLRLHGVHAFSNRENPTTHLGTKGLEDGGFPETRTSPQHEDASYGPSAEDAVQRLLLLG